MRGADEFFCEFFRRAGEKIVSPYVEVFDYSAFCGKVKFNDTLWETSGSSKIISRRLAEIPLVCAVSGVLQMIDPVELFLGECVGGGVIYPGADIIAEESGEPEDIGVFVLQMVADVGNSFYIASDSLADEFFRPGLQGFGKVCGADLEHQCAVHQHSVLVDADGVAGEFLSVYGEVVPSLEFRVDANASEGLDYRGSEPLEHLRRIDGGFSFGLFDALDESEVEVSQIMEDSTASAKASYYRNAVGFYVV